MDVTLKKVSELAGVDRSTVSRVLRSDPSASVRPETRERILRIARQLNYQPNARARGLRLRQSFTLGVLAPDIENPVLPEIIRGADDAAREAGYALLLSHCTERTLHEKLHVRLLREHRVDGLLLATPQTGGALVDEISQLGAPFVLINPRQDGAGAYVIVDDFGGAKMAVDHLVALGHRRIAHLAGPLYTDKALRRLKGYRQSLADHNILYDPCFVEECEFSVAHGKDRMRSLLERIPRPTAVFAANLQTAVGALAAIRTQGLRVPEDISLVGFHDAPLCEWLSPPLTTIKFPLYQLGFEATRVLLRLISGSADVARKVLPPTGLIERGSTAPPAPDSED